MTYEELQDVFWDLCNLLVQDEVTAPADQYIRWKYPETGQPDWKLTDNVLFLFLNERDDDYGKQMDTTWDTSGEHVIRKRSRTRIWELTLTAYGPKACEIVNRIKDGVFRRDAKELLARHSVFLVPDLPAAQNAPDLFSGKWWPRWDLVLHFNELYELQPEDVGSIETVSVEAEVARH